MNTHQFILQTYHYSDSKTRQNHDQKKKKLLTNISDKYRCTKILANWIP